MIYATVPPERDRVMSDVQEVGQPEVIDFKEPEEEVRILVGGISPIVRPILAKIRQALLAPVRNLNLAYILSQKAVANSKLYGRLL